MANTSCVYYPNGVYVTSRNELYIAEYSSQRIRKVTITTVAIMEGVNPTSVFVTEWNQDIYVTDSNKHRVFVFFPNQTISIVAGNGVSGNSQDGDSALGSVLFSPDSVHVTKQNEIFISDTSNNRIKKVVNGRIYTIAGNGLFQDTGVKGVGGDALSGPAVNAYLRSPQRVRVASNGEVYFVDRANERIKKINSQGNIQVMAGIGSVGYNGENQLATRATLTNVQDVWVAPSSGDLYIADGGNNRVRRVDSKTLFIQNVAGNGYAYYFGNGVTAKDASFSNLLSLFMASNGDMYIAEMSLIRKVSPSQNGLITTVTMIDEWGSLYNARGHFVTPQDEIFFAVQWGNQVKKFTMSTGETELIAGTGMMGDSGEGGLAVNARLRKPSAVFQNPLDASLLFIVDTGNHKIKMVNMTDGTISTFCGTGSAGYSGDNDTASPQCTNDRFLSFQHE